MSAPIWLFYNGWGMLALEVFIGSYTVAHVLGLLRWETAQFCAKLLGLGGLVALFLTSGWSGGLFGLGLGIGLASVALWLSRPARVATDPHHHEYHSANAVDFPIPSPVKKPTPAFRLFG
jgi:hypothetical protein